MTAYATVGCVTDKPDVIAGSVTETAPTVRDGGVTVLPDERVGRVTAYATDGSVTDTPELIAGSPSVTVYTNAIAVITVVLVIPDIVKD